MQRIQHCMQEYKRKYIACYDSFFFRKYIACYDSFFPLKMNPPSNLPKQKTQIPRCTFKLDQIFCFCLYREIPRNLSFPFWGIWGGGAFPVETIIGRDPHSHWPDGLWLVRKDMGCYTGIHPATGRNVGCLKYIVLFCRI